MSVTLLSREESIESRSEVALEVTECGKTQADIIRAATVSWELLLHKTNVGYTSLTWYLLRRDVYIWEKL